MKRGGSLPRHTRLETRTRLTRSSPLPRGETPIRKRNAKRNGSRFPKRRDPAYCAWIRSLDCVARGTESAARRYNNLRLAHGQEAIVAVEPWLILFGVRDCCGPVECAHVVSRGAGGDDVANTVPLCRAHHRQQHDKGIETFQRFYTLDLAAVAAELGQRYEMDGGAW